VRPAEKQAARERQRLSRGRGKKVRKVSVPLGEARDKAARYTGMSGRTLDKTTAVVAAADRNTPGKFPQVFKAGRAAGRTHRQTSRKIAGKFTRRLPRQGGSLYRHVPPHPWTTFPGVRMRDRDLSPKRTPARLLHRGPFCGTLKSRETALVVPWAGPVTPLRGRAEQHRVHDNRLCSRVRPTTA
jgi:hypothetical protein